MKLKFTLLCLVSCTLINAQYTLRLIVNEVATKKLDDIYVAGSFNNWNLRDAKYKLKPFGTTRRAIILNEIPAGDYEFKFSRGSQNNVETTAKGQEVPNHKIYLKEDLSLDFNIPGWKDDYPDRPKPYTATTQVSTMDTAFAIPQLNRKRTIWVYLPKGYATSRKMYPVIYMHDGQNLFNEQTSVNGEWGVDEFLDSAMRKYKKECIVIGINSDNEKRMTEYNPYDNKQYGRGEGKEYTDFVALTLKPFVDKKYRTQKEAKYTFIAGSGSAAVISLYALIRYPNVFGGAGIFSPSFSLTPEISADIQKADWSASVPKFFFYGGGKENENMIRDMDKIIATVERKGRYATTRLVSPIAKHNEEAWRQHFPVFFQFIME